MVLKLEFQSEHNSDCEVIPSVRADVRRVAGGWLFLAHSGSYSAGSQSSSCPVTVGSVRPQGHTRPVQSLGLAPRLPGEFIKCLAKGAG